MSYTNYHPVYLDLNGRNVLIVGGGAIAEEKLNSLLPSGARITVVSPEASQAIRDWFEKDEIIWVPRTFRESDVEPAYMVIAATDDAALNAFVYQCGNSRQRLTNSVDDPANCNFIMAAITRRGPMQVAVSSAGCSPALAQRVRNRISSEILTDDLGELAEFVGSRRDLVKSRLPGYKVRQAFWERVLASDVPDHLRRGDEERASARFLELLERAVAAAPGDFDPQVGKVFLVGAGPGDPELITLKAIRALQRADVILYDRLVNTVLLDHANRSADRIYVGKEVGHPEGGRQAYINALLIELARRGKTVVRLKGGDPFVFGRGGEEMLALHEAGVEFEVISGVSSAVSGPAAAGIPVTHRGISTAFAVFAGQEAKGRDDVPWDVAAKIPTAVFLMGVERLAQIVSKLLEAGRSEDTPVAIVSKATLPDERVVSGTLATIARLAEGVESPAVIVVGEVVGVRERLTSVVKSASVKADKKEILALAD